VSDKHFCDNPDWFTRPRWAEIGSLWECIECGREQIKMSKDDDGYDWYYTVELVDKRVQKARRSSGRT
jgi:hypothetical protein